MKELGGYIEFEHYHGNMLHEDAVALNCGRNALAYLIKTRKIRRLWIPKLICGSVTGVCERERVPYSFYSIGPDFLPAHEIRLEDGEWLYFVNYYSRFTNDQILEYVKAYGRVIVDQAQSYFQEPLQRVDTLYTCRKYFGVADGAFLYTDTLMDEELPLDVSCERMHFLMGRFEKTASEYYGEYIANNKLFADEPVKRMSRLTRNLLHGIDYACVRTVRESNFVYLHRILGEINGLKKGGQTGTFMYPLLLKNGSEIRKKLQAEKIYVPTLWPDVFDRCGVNETEYEMANNILPLPIDQRYGPEDMEYIGERIWACLKN